MNEMFRVFTSRFKGGAERTSSVRAARASRGRAQNVDPRSVMAHGSGSAGLVWIGVDLGMARGGHRGMHGWEFPWHVAAGPWWACWSVRAAT
jgi:hypothetical protein